MRAESAFTGVGSDYEAPTNPDILIDSDKESVEQSASRVLDWLKQHGATPDA
jgi:adenylylsulfate kinase